MNTKRLAEINAGSCPSIDEWKELEADRSALIAALRDENDSVVDFIIAVDKLMAGPPAPIRGNKLAELVTILQHKNEQASALLAQIEGKETV